MPTDELPSGEGTEQVADTAPDTAVETPEWDGTDATLNAQPWWKGVPDTAKDHIKGTFERREFFQNLVNAEDATAHVVKQMDGLKATLSAEVEKHKGEAASWKEKHDTVHQQLTSYQTEAEEARINARETEVQTKYGDIYASFETAEGDKSESPLVMFVRLTEQQGITDERAAKMVRAAFDMPTPGVAAAPAAAVATPPKTREVEPPDSVTMANKNGLNASEAMKKPAPLSPDEARRILNARIEAEEEADAAAGR